MRSLKFAAFAAFFSSLVLLAGCASTQSADQAVVSVSAQVNKACIVAMPTLNSLTATSDQLTEDQRAKLQQAESVIVPICTIAEDHSPQSVQQLVQTAFPLVIGLVAGSSMDQPTKTKTVILLTAAQVAVSAALAQSQ